MIFSRHPRDMNHAESRCIDAVRLGMQRVRPRLQSPSDNRTHRDPFVGTTCSRRRTAIFMQAMLLSPTVLLTAATARRAARDNLRTWAKFTPSIHSRASGLSVDRAYSSPSTGGQTDGDPAPAVRRLRCFSADLRHRCRPAGQAIPMSTYGVLAPWTSDDDHKASPTSSRSSATAAGNTEAVRLDIYARYNGRLS